MGRPIGPSTARGVTGNQGRLCRLLISAQEPAGGRGGGRLISRGQLQTKTKAGRQGGVGELPSGSLSATHEMGILRKNVLGSLGGAAGGQGAPRACVRSLQHWNPFVVLIVQKGLLSRELWLVRGCEARERERQCY